MRRCGKAWLVGLAFGLSVTAAGLAAEDCRLSGDWFTKSSDAIYSFSQTRNGKKDGTFSYQSHSQNLVYHGTYYLEEKDTVLHLRFRDERQGQRDFYYHLTMAGPRESLFTIDAVMPNPALPQGPQEFHVLDTGNRILNLSLCKT